MTARTCPRWCTRCDLAGDVPATGGEMHRSTPVELDLPSQLRGDQTQVFVQLRQPVSVHDTQVVVAMWRPGDRLPLLIPLVAGRVALTELVRLLGQADLDIVLAAAEQHGAQRAAAVAAVRGSGRDA